MRNAKDEFLGHVNDKTVLCATVSHDNYYREEDQNISSLLPKSYSPKDYLLFLESLDYEYDGGFGGQELFGTIWYTDGTWSQRGEYDGSEWWEHCVVPEIPEELT